MIASYVFVEGNMSAQRVVSEKLTIPADIASMEWLIRKHARQAAIANGFPCDDSVAAVVPLFQHMSWVKTASSCWGTVLVSRRGLDAISTWLRRFGGDMGRRIALVVLDADTRRSISCGKALFRPKELSPALTKSETTGGTQKSKDRR